MGCHAPVSYFELSTCRRSATRRGRSPGLVGRRRRTRLGARRRPLRRPGRGRRPAGVGGRDPDGPPPGAAVRRQRATGRRRPPRRPVGPLLPRTPQRPIDAAFAAALHRFADRPGRRVRAWFGHRYQMNEVGRCTQTALALGAVQRLAPGRRLALIDVGTGSGLGLGLDRYHIDLGGGRSFGPPDSPVRLTCAVDGDTPAAAGSARHRLAPRHRRRPDRPRRRRLAGLAGGVHAADDRRPGAPGRRRRADPRRRDRGPGRRRRGPAARRDRRSTTDLLVVVLDSYTAVFLDDAGRRGDAGGGRPSPAATSCGSRSTRSCRSARRPTVASRTSRSTRRSSPATAPAGCSQCCSIAGNIGGTPGGADARHRPPVGHPDDVAPPLARRHELVIATPAAAAETPSTSVAPT